MIRTQVSLDPDMYESAREEARRLGISFAEICRRALGQWLKQSPEPRPWLRFAGALEGDAESSQSVDDVVYGRERL